MTRIFEKYKVVIGFGIVSIPMVLQPALSFVFLALVANIATVKVYGSLSLALVLVSIIVSFSDLGLRDFLLSKKSIEMSLSKGSNLFFPAMVTSLVLMAIIVFYLFFVSYDDVLLLFLMYLPEAFAFGVLHKCVFFSYQQKLNPVDFSKIDVWCKSVPFATKVALVYFLENVYLSIFLGSFCTLLLYSFWFYSRCYRSEEFFHSESVISVIVDVFSIWKMWLPFTISFLSFFLYFSSDKILIEALLGVEQLALYSAAYSFITIGQIFVGVLWSIYMPRISRGVEGVTKVVLLRGAIFVSVLLVVFYYGFSKLIFGMIYPKNYEFSSFLLSLLSLFFLFRVPNVVFEMYWVAWDKYSLFVKARIFVGIFNLGANVLFIPVFGVIAAAVTTILAEAILTLFVLVCEKKWKV